MKKPFTYNYDQKFKLLAVTAIILLFCIYQFSLINASKQYKIYKRYKENATELIHEASLASLILREQEIDSVLGKYVIDTLDESKNLLNVASMYCDQNNINLKEYSPLSTRQIDSMTVQTKSVTIEGGYKECLEFVYHLERKVSAGRVCSVLFKTVVDQSTADTLLDCVIHIQNISSSLNEKN